MKVETSNLQSICACHVIVQRQTRSCLAVVGVVVGGFCVWFFFFHVCCCAECECKLFVMLVLTGNWAKIARELGNRTDNQCWRRWMVLRKEKVG